MARARISHAVTAALAGTAAAVSLSFDRPEMSGMYLGNTCWREADLSALARMKEEHVCDSLIPRYSMDKWIEQHGSTLPDHPAIFVDTHTRETRQWGKDSFLRDFANASVNALPEYAQRNGNLQNWRVEAYANFSLASLVRGWNTGKLYHVDTKCYKKSICGKVAKKFGTPKLFETEKSNPLLTVGGPGSGMPFHKNQMQWQGLSMGRKAWYVLPPGAMSEYLHDSTGPYVFPVRAFHGLMRNEPVGKRPLYCIQRPGETMYIPDNWWHATMNMDSFQVSYGAKIGGMKKIRRSREKANITHVFPPQAFDTAGESSANAGPPETTAPFPFALAARTTEMRRTCGVGVETKTRGFEEPLQRIKAYSGSHFMDCLHETAAYAHCALARTFEEIYESAECYKKLPIKTRHDLRARAMRWLQEARALSPALVQREPWVCKRIPPRGPSNATGRVDDLAATEN